MPAKKSTVVIGSGVIGMATAYYLAAEGRAVTVIDRAPDAADGASFANGGMLTPSLVDPWNAPGVFWKMLTWIGREDAPLLLRPQVLPQLLGWGVEFLRQSGEARFRANMAKNLSLSVYSLQMMAELRETLGLTYDQALSGSLKVFRSSRDLNESLARSELLQSFGLHLEAKDRKQVLALEPALGDIADSIAGGVFCPSDELGDARLFTHGLARAARDLGAELRFNEQVIGFQMDGDRIGHVLTDTETHTADDVVVAAGCWSPKVLRQLGMKLQVQPVKGYSLTLDADRWLERPGLAVIDDALHAAVVPLGKRLRVAGTAELAGYDDRLAAGRIANLRTLLAEIYPASCGHLDAMPARAWTGLRPVTPNGVPVIGRRGFANLYLNTGHGHLGWTMAAGSGRLLADVMVGRRPAIDPAQFN
ncbi:D-amino acid dehydrogenase [Phenylobacterium sp. LH3H17]|uniref:D-amino acid dehydrogenase n=1 Tax=Phenylobacterium sp. LH3H17 TaxID=2903901 RepID=UPI0020C95DAB|nr:D-amino acid dehydrogenase [Phenylobacterium sp. LH3H17]UTP38271.1 D-amino acid dehydrogenase [Phenylobacterium sp. LH3H17]